MSAKLSLVIQSFGKKNEYLRAIFTIWSFFAYSSIKKEDILVLLYTDNPRFFKLYFQELPIEYCLLDDEKIKALRGEIDFLHFMKIGIIEDAFNRNWGKVLYCDSDTFFIEDPLPYIEIVSKEKAFMHLKEYRFSEVDQGKLLPNQPAMFKFLKAIESGKFTGPDNSEIEVNLLKDSWNAGVMVFHPEHKLLLPKVYALTEQFFRLSNCHASEQFAFSVVFQNEVNVFPCEKLSYHYWYKVKKQVMDEFLVKNLNRSLASQNLENKLDSVKRITQFLPAYFEKHVWMLRDKAIQDFNTNNYKRGYINTFKAVISDPFNIQFIKDVLYHTKRILVP